MERRVAVVVEDDDDIRMLLEAVLQQSGFDVHAAANGADGVELVLEHRPQLVTLDLGLPDIDGFEVARRVRSTSDAHIVMLTARTDEIDTVMGLESGADHYLTKPFRPRELRAQVEAIMRRRPAPVPVGASTAVGPVPGTTAVPGSGASAASAPVAEGAAAGALAVARPGGVFATPPSTASGASAGTPPEAVGASEILALNGLELFPALHCVKVDGRELALTPTEFSLLRALLEAGRRVLTKTGLVRMLRGDAVDANTFVSAADERTVEVHMGNLRRKLGDAARSPRFVETVRGVGYRAAQQA